MGLSQWRAKNEEDDRPLERLYQLFEKARRIDEVESRQAPGGDPLRGLREMINQARREEAGRGGEALKELEDKIEEARRLPTPTPYRRPHGDPLQALMARVHGEEPGDGVDRAVGEDSEIQSAGEGRRARELDEGLGRVVGQSLRRQPLSGPIRAEVARRLAVVLEKRQDPELEAIFELVVFGEIRLGSDDSEG